MHIRTHAHTHTCTYACTHAHTHTHTHAQVAVAHAFEFIAGPKSVRVRAEHVGLAAQWLGAWTPDLDPGDRHEACLLLEDDLFLMTS